MIFDKTIDNAGMLEVLFDKAIHRKDPVVLATVGAYDTRKIAGVLATVGAHVKSGSSWHVGNRWHPRQERKPWACASHIGLAIVMSGDDFVPCVAA